MNKKKKEKEWKTEKARLESLSLEERRLLYGRSDFVSLDKIPTWSQASKDEEEGKDLLRDKISLYKGDITILEVDAIVNAANSSLLGGGGVDGCIHKAAGPCLYDECHTLGGCDTGKAKITCGYDLPAKHVIHTVGPVARGHVGQSERDDLTACYQNSLRLLEDHDLRTVAFPCISTGIYGFPNEPAAEIALRTVKSWMEDNYAQVTRVIFCVFLETDYNIYKEKIPHIFHGNTLPSKGSRSKSQTGESNADGEDAAADVEMLSQKVNMDNVDMESQKPDQTVQETDEREEKDSTAAPEKPASDRAGSEEFADERAEGERKQIQTSVEPEEDVKKDGADPEETEALQEAMEGVEDSAGIESGRRTSGVEEAQGKRSQGSDLTQTDSTQSKEPVEKKE